MPEKKKPTRIRALKIEELSLVDTPANRQSRVILAKREDGMFKPCADCKSVEKCSAVQKCAGEMKKSDESAAIVLLRRVAKKLGLSSDELNDDEPSSHSEESVAKKDYSKMTPDELRAELAKRDGGSADDAVEAVTKKLSDLETKLETVSKKLEDKTTEVAELKADRATSLIAKRARVMKGHATVEDAEVTTVLKQLDEDGVKAFESILKKFSGVVEEAELFEPVGKRGADAPANAHERIHKRAIELVKNGDAPSYQQAVTLAMEEDPDAYEEALEESLD